MIPVLSGVLLALLVVSPSGQSQSRAPFIGEDFLGRECAGSPGSYGPFDYTMRARLARELRTVENYHFTADVESLKRSNTTMSPYGDLAYTLGAWPNHHRALNALSRFQLQPNRKRKAPRIPAECWFQRAIHFSPGDPTTRMLYAMHLHNSDKLDDARQTYEQALELNSGDISLHYNFALLLVDMKEYNNAKHHAKIAYTGDFPLQGLKNRLADAGYWP